MHTMGWTPPRQALDYFKAKLGERPSHGTFEVEVDPVTSLGPGQGPGLIRIGRAEDKRGMAGYAENGVWPNSNIRRLPRTHVLGNGPCRSTLMGEETSGRVGWREEKERNRALCESGPVLTSAGVRRQGDPHPTPIPNQPHPPPREEGKHGWSVLAVLPLLPVEGGSRWVGRRGPGGDEGGLGVEPDGGILKCYQGGGGFY